MATHIDELYEAHADARRLQDENDRLRAVNAELLTALRDIADAGEEAWGDTRPCVEAARAAIAKASEVTP